MVYGEDETSTPVTQILNHIGSQEDKKLKFLGQTICKLSGPDNRFIDEIIECLSLVFQCEPTSPVMYNHQLKQFYVFISLAKKEA